MRVNNQILNMTRWYVRIIALPPARRHMCATVVISAVLCALVLGANAEPVAEGDPNSPPQAGAAQVTPDVNTADPNVPDANVTDPNTVDANAVDISVADVNVADANAVDANTPDTEADLKTQQQPQAQSITATGRLIQGNATNIHDLWRASIVAEIEPNDKGKTQLEKLIAQINSIKLGQTGAEFKTEPNSISVAKNEPNEAPAEPKTQKPDVPETNKAEDLKVSPDGLLAPETLAMYGKHIQEPNDVNEPFELAEILYSSGYLPEAAVAYQQALSRTDPNNSTTAAKRAWILSQIGNCLRQTKPQEAMQSYKQLINEYPSSPWTEFAVAMNGVLDWLNQDKPYDLMAEVQRLKAELSN